HHAEVPPLYPFLHTGAGHGEHEGLAVAAHRCRLSERGEPHRLGDLFTEHVRARRPQELRFVHQPLRLHSRSDSTMPSTLCGKRSVSRSPPTCCIVPITTGGMADGPRSTLTQAQIPAHRPHLPLRPRHRSTLSTGVRGPESTSPQPARMRSRGPDCHYRSRSSTVLDGAASSVPGLRAASPSAVPGPSDRVRIEQRSAPARTSWGAEGGKIGGSAPTSPTTG